MLSIAKELYNQTKIFEVKKTSKIVKERLIKEERHLHYLLEKGEVIYGANTLVGHKDEHKLTSEEFAEMQEYLINNHCLPSDDYFSSFESRCIGFVKAHHISLGHTGISYELFEEIKKALSKESFKPLIPKTSSYSCGDVIPGAHWSKSLLSQIRKTKQYKLKPKEGISLINGCFVHLGYGVALLKELESFWYIYLFNSQLNTYLSLANPTNYNSEISKNVNDAVTTMLSFIKTKNTNKSVQDPVSLRSFPQISGAVYQTLLNYLDALDKALSRPSDNPLISLKEGNALSQGSFVAPYFSLVTGQLIDAVLMILWSVEQRFHNLLGGKVHGIPQDGVTAKDPLGFIQVPKQMTAILEHLRTIGSRRIFASGHSTSHGVEDFWSYGVTSLDILKTVLEGAKKILTLENLVMNNLIYRFRRDLINELNPVKHVVFEEKKFNDCYHDLINYWNSKHQHFIAYFPEYPNPINLKEK